MRRSTPPCDTPPIDSLLTSTEPNEGPTSIAASRSYPSWRNTLAMLLLSVSVTAIVCLPALRGFLQTPAGDEFTFLVKHYEEWSRSRGLSVWWVALADGPPNHIQPLAAAATSLLFVLHRVLAHGLGLSAGTAVALFNYTLFAAGAGVLATALTRTLHTRPTTQQHLGVAASTSIAVLALFTTGNSGVWNPFTSATPWGWFPVFVALALALRLTDRGTSSAWRWASASFFVSAFYGPAVIILVAGLLAHRTTKPIREVRSTVGKEIILLLAASAGLLADVVWTVVYRNALGGHYEGVTPVDITQLPRSLIGSISSNLNGLDSLRFSLLAQVDSRDIALAALVAASILASWRHVSGAQNMMLSEQHLPSSSLTTSLLWRTSVILALGAGIPFIASKKYASTAFSPPTFQYFNSVFVMAALMALLSTVLRQRPASASRRLGTLVAVGTLVLISSANLSSRAEEHAGTPPSIKALDHLIAESQTLSCADLAPLFLDRNSSGLAEDLNSLSTARHGYSPCPPYSDNFISTMHLTGGSSQPEFDQFGWWFWLGSGDVQFRLELKTTAFDHVDIPLTPAECEVALAPGVSATPGEVLDRGVLRLNRNHFDVREPDFASIEFTVAPTSYACLIEGDSRPLAIRVGMPVLIH